MMNLGALDIVSSGTRFSWTNNIQDIDGISQRLDRVLVSQDWATIFPKAIIINLPTSYLVTIQFSFTKMVYLRNIRKDLSDSWRIWFRDNSCKEFIQSKWTKSNTHGSFHIKLDHLAGKLSFWNKSHFGFILEIIKDIENRLNFIQTCKMDPNQATLEKFNKNKVMNNDINLVLCGNKNSRN